MTSDVEINVSTMGHGQSEDVSNTVVPSSFTYTHFIWNESNFKTGYSFLELHTRYQKLKTISH